MDPNTTQCAQHIAIASMNLPDYVTESARFERQVRVGTMIGSLTEEDLANDAELLDHARHTQHRVQELWQAIWEQLDGAREVVARMGRDTKMYDDTRALAREYGAGATLEVGPWTQSSGAVYMRTVEREVGPPKVIQHAIAVLLAVVSRGGAAGAATRRGCSGPRLVEARAAHRRRDRDCPRHRARGRVVSSDALIDRYEPRTSRDRTRFLLEVAR